MKLFLFLLLPISVCAGKMYTLDVNITSRLTKESIGNVSIVLFYKGEEVSRGITDLNGFVKFSGLKEKVYDLEIYGDTLQYENLRSTVFSPKKLDLQEAYTLVPTKEYFLKKCELIVNEFFETIGKNYPPNIVEECKDTTPSILQSFPGGQEWLQFYLSNYLNYPQECLERNEQGKVVIQFYVEPNGTISNIYITKRANKLLDEEARRLIESMPRWIPCVCREKRIISGVKLPINFTLD